MKKGVVCLGEALIDFIPTDKTNLTYEKCPGGAPANVAVGLAKLGAKSTFVGKVGDDVLGSFLKGTLEGYGVETRLVFSSEAKTGLTFVTLSENGERDFVFYINSRADSFLQEDEIDESLFGEHKILHIGSISMINEPSRSATLKAIRLAKKAGMWLSYDQSALWENEDLARKTMASVLSEVDILKISGDELAFMTGKQKITEGIRALTIYEIPLIFVTLGADGSYIFSESSFVKVPAMSVEAVDTTGAGDAFVSGALYSLNEMNHDLTSLNENQITKISRFASISGGLAASTKGSMTSLPTLEQIMTILKSDL